MLRKIINNAKPTLCIKNSRSISLKLLGNEIKRTIGTIESKEPQIKYSQRSLLLHFLNHIYVGTPNTIATGYATKVNTQSKKTPTSSSLFIKKNNNKIAPGKRGAIRKATNVLIFKIRIHFYLFNLWAMRPLI